MPHVVVEPVTPIVVEQLIATTEYDTIKVMKQELQQLRDDQAQRDRMLKERRLFEKEKAQLQKQLDGQHNQLEVQQRQLQRTQEIIDSFTLAYSCVLKDEPL